MECDESIGQEIISRLKEIIRILDIEYAEKCGKGEVVGVGVAGEVLEGDDVGEFERQEQQRVIEVEQSKKYEKKLGANLITDLSREFSLEFPGIDIIDSFIKKRGYSSEELSEDWSIS